MPKKEKAKTETRQKAQITRASFASIFWSFIVILPFGWFILWYGINRRRKEAELGIRSKECAKKTIQYYLSGFIIAILLIIFLFIMMQAEIPRSDPDSFEFSQNPTGGILVINVVAVFVILTSVSNNIGRLDDDDTKHKLEPTKEIDWLTMHTLPLSSYESGYENLRNRLESLDSKDEKFEQNLQKIKIDINRFVSEFRNVSPEDGPKYKLYELMAEYYFVSGDKRQAKKYIDMAIKIKKQEDK